MNRHSSNGRCSKSYRTALLRMKAQLASSLGAKEEDPPERIAEDDQALASHEEFVSNQINHLEYERFRLVEEALDRLKSGE